MGVGLDFLVHRQRYTYVHKKESVKTADPVKLSVVKNELPNTRNPEKLIPGLWARLVQHRSGWTINAIDQTFFANQKSGGSGKPSSAFRRYMQCQSSIRHQAYAASENPFLQIDSCWPGTFRYLVHPYVDLLTAQTDLVYVHKCMVLVEARFRRILFAGAVYRLHRKYQDPAGETEALRVEWESLNTPKLRERFFPDMMCSVLGWIQEACIIGDRQRLKLISGFDSMRRFGVSFERLDFLDASFATFLHRWNILLIEDWDLDPNRLSDLFLAPAFVANSSKLPTVNTVLELSALISAVFAAEATTERSLAEDAVRHLLDSNGRAALRGLKGKVSWDRSELVNGCQKARESGCLG